MHHLIAWSVVVVAAVAVAGCADPVGPSPRGVGDPSLLAELARRPRPPASIPDSVRLPPMPIVPIYEEFPTIIDGRQ